MLIGYLGTVEDRFGDDLGGSPRTGYSETFFIRPAGRWQEISAKKKYPCSWPPSPASMRGKLVIRSEFADASNIMEVIVARVNYQYEKRQKDIKKKKKQEEKRIKKANRSAEKATDSTTPSGDTPEQDSDQGVS